MELKGDVLGDLMTNKEKAFKGHSVLPVFVVPKFVSWVSHLGASSNFTEFAFRLSAFYSPLHRSKSLSIVRPSDAETIIIRLVV